MFDDNKLLGIITDGDLRRMLEKNTDINSINISDIMCSNPKIISSDQLKKALNIMEKNNINQLLVVDKDNYVGIIHIHDILKGVFNENQRKRNVFFRSFRSVKVAFS